MRKRRRGRCFDHPLVIESAVADIREMRVTGNRGSFAIWCAAEAAERREPENALIYLLNMSIDFTAHVYELTEWKPRRKDVLTPFSGKFFRGPINSSMRWCELGEHNGVIGCLYEFFLPDQDAKRVMVVVSRESVEPLGEPDARGVLGQFVGPTQKEPVSRVLWARGPLEMCCPSVSQYLRESGSLTEADFDRVGRLCIASDARGIAVVDTTSIAPPPGERCHRLAALCALAFAYRSVLDDAIDLLAVAGRNSGRSSEVQLRSWSQFMSSYYFHEPIKLATIELARFYAAVRDRHKIPDVAREVTDQLKLLAELVRLDRSEIQANREKSIQRRIGATGLILALGGLLFTFAQVTPKVLSESYFQWRECEKSVGALGCLRGGYQDPTAANLKGSPIRGAAAGSKKPASRP